MSSNLITADNGVSSGVTGITQSGGSDGTLQLRTTSSGGTATTALTINNSQYVGIGTTSPVSPFQVNVGTNQNFKVKSQGGVVNLSAENDASSAQVTMYFNSGAMTLDNSGKLGLGTSSPDIEGLGSSYLGLTIYNPTALYPATQIYATQSTSSSSAEMGRIHFLNGTNRVCQILVKPDGANNNSAYYALSTMKSGTLNEALRVDSNGNLLVNTTSAISSSHTIVKNNSGGYSLTTENTAGGSSDGGFQCLAGTNSSTTYAFVCGYYSPSPTQTFRIYGNGTYGTVSDLNRKKNVESARDGYLTDLNKLRVVKYNWKTQEDGEAKELGFIAQEIEQVFPALVETDKDDLKMIKQPVLIPMLVKAIQELSAELTALKAKVGA